MHILPILSTLRRHRTAALLIVLEIALTCAIVCNAIFLITDRLSQMDRSSGVVEDELVRVQVAGIGETTNVEAVTTQDLAALRALPGVKSVTTANMVPFGRSSWNNGVSNKPHDNDTSINAAMYIGSPDFVETLGVHIIAGRDFAPDEYVSYDALKKEQAKMGSILISQGMADYFWPGQSVLGKQIYVWGDDPQVIVGVFDVLARPNDNAAGAKGRGYSMILPINGQYDLGGNYMLRVDPARKGEVLAAVEAALDKVDPHRVILKRQTFAELRAEYFKADRAMAWLLLGVSIALLVITALGVVGLASFWVQQRTRQIGIRRALGATKTDILRYFQTENFILATAGIVLGMGLAYAMNLWLMGKYDVPRLPATFLPIGAALLWLLGQIAVLGPALRASLIPPAIATRSV